MTQKDSNYWLKLARAAEEKKNQALAAEDSSARLEWTGHTIVFSNAQAFGEAAHIQKAEALEKELGPAFMDFAEAFDAKRLPPTAAPEVEEAGNAANQADFVKKEPQGEAQLTPTPAKAEAVPTPPAETPNTNPAPTAAEHTHTKPSGHVHGPGCGHQHGTANAEKEAALFEKEGNWFARNKTTAIIAGVGVLLGAGIWASRASKEKQATAQAADAGVEMGR